MEKLKVFFRTFFITVVIIYLWVWLYSCKNYTKVDSPQQLHLFPKSTSQILANSSSWISQFREHECKIYSQNGEDGVLLWIFTHIGTRQYPPNFVEFGVENGLQCNTRFLRQHLNWKGLMMDGSNENLAINLHKESITEKNINDLLAKYQTPSYFDLLSIDVDFDDYFIWKSILKDGRYRPRVVVIEFNYDIPTHENRVVNPYQDNRRWTGTMHFGASILAMASLGRAYGYTLVYGEQNGVNLFFVETKILKELGILHQVPSLEKLHVTVPITRWKHAPEPNISRPWIWNDTKWG